MKRTGPRSCFVVASDALEAETAGECRCYTRHTNPYQAKLCLKRHPGAGVARIWYWAGRWEFSEWRVAPKAHPPSLHASRRLLRRDAERLIRATFYGMGQLLHRGRSVSPEVLQRIRKNLDTYEQALRVSDDGAIDSPVDMKISDALEPSDYVGNAHLRGWEWGTES